MQPAMRLLWMCCSVWQCFDNFQSTYYCNQNQQTHKANLKHKETYNYIIIGVTVQFLADIWEWVKWGKSHKRWQGQRYDGGACDGVAVSCNADKLKKKKEARWEGEGCDRCDNFNSRDKIQKCVTNWEKERRMKNIKKAREWGIYRVDWKEK